MKIKKQIFLATITILGVFVSVKAYSQNNLPKNTLRATAKIEQINIKKNTKLTLIDLESTDKTTKAYYNDFSMLMKDSYGDKAFSMYSATYQDGILSVDSTYAVIVETKALSPRYPGGKQIGVNERAYDLVVTNDVSLINASGRKVWSQKYDWGGKQYSGLSGGLWVLKVSNRGNATLISIRDTTRNALDRGGYPSIYVVYNKKGNEAYRYQKGGGTSEPNITDNGRFFYVGESVPYQHKEIWTVCDLVNRDSVKVIRTTEGPVQVDNDGRITMTSRKSIGGIKWFTYDSLKAAQGSNQK